MALAASAMAAPTISSWSIDSDGQSETLNLRWNESGPWEVSQFEDARQLVILIPGASVREKAPRSVDLSASKVVTRARLQPVTLAKGEKAVQLTLHLAEWVNFETVANESGLSLRLPVPEELRSAPAPAEDSGLELTDESIRQMEERGFGSANAPKTGAGQAPAASAGLEDYYVPPPVDRSRLGASQSTDIADLMVQSKLNEVVKRVDFQGTALENVLRLIAEQAELNILIKPGDVANKRVTLRLRNVTLRQLMDSILKVNDLGYTIEPGGIVIIVPRNLVKSTDKEMLMDTISINWVDARDVATALRPFMDRDDNSRGGAQIEVAAASNLLIIRDVPENVRRIRDLVEQIDVAEKQVLIEMRLVNMTETARRAFGTRTDVAAQNTDPRFVTDPTTGAVGSSTSSSGSGSNSSTSGSASDSLATGPTRTNTSSGGTNSTSSNSSTSASNIIPTTAGGAGLLAPGASAFGMSQLATVAIFGENYDVNFRINAQEDRGEAVTLANPTVLSLNNVEARVEIKRQIPYTTGINTTDGSVGTVEFKDIGTEVTLLPRITNHGYVQMRIAPEQIIDTGERPGGVPQTDERRVEASVIVKDEQTIALGGLRQFESAASESGVPYLLRVPVISWLFKNQTNSQSKTELYLFVTPHIVKDPTPTNYQQALYEKIDYNWDLPDYYFDEVMARKAPGEEEDPSIKKK